METETLATLEKALQEWANQQCETNHWLRSIRGAWIPDDLAEKMALASAAVFDVNVSGQIIAAEYSDK